MDWQEIIRLDIQHGSSADREDHAPAETGRYVFDEYTMNNLKRIRLMWDDYQSMAFPDGYAGKDINDICVSSLDTFAAGCISAYVGDGRLDNKRIEVLHSCLDDLDSIIPELDEHPKEYFNALKAICVEIVKDTKVPKIKS